MPIDYSRYPPNWKTEIVPRILERAGNCCEFCNLENKQKVWSVPVKVSVNGRYSVKRIWVEKAFDVERMKWIQHITREFKIKQVEVVLTVAHLDHDEENHEVPDDRLAALCQYCHLNYDAQEKFRRAVLKSK